MTFSLVQVSIGQCCMAAWLGSRQVSSGLERARRDAVKFLVDWSDPFVCPIPILIVWKLDPIVSQHCESWTIVSVSSQSRRPRVRGNRENGTKRQKLWLSFNRLARMGFSSRVPLFFPVPRFAASLGSGIPPARFYLCVHAAATESIALFRFACRPTDIPARTATGHAVYAIRECAVNLCRRQYAFSLKNSRLYKLLHACVALCTSAPHSLRSE